MVQVYSLVIRPTGEVIAAGQFLTAAGTPVNHIAQWDPAANGGEGAWSTLGSGVKLIPDSSADYARALTIDARGDLIVGGLFGQAGEIISPHLARYGCPPPPLCVADCDASGALSIDDFICFQTVFVLGEAKADCDGNGSLSIDDYVCYQAHFAMGC